MGGREGGKSLIFHCFSNRITISATFEKDRKLMETESQNEVKIDAKIIKDRFWAARGATHVDLEYLLEVF